MKGNGDMRMEHGGNARRTSTKDLGSESPKYVAKVRAAVAAVLVGALAVSVAAEASSSQPAPPSTTSAQPTTTTTDPTAKGGMATSTTTAAAQPGPTLAFCDAARAQADRLRRVQTSLTDPARLQAVLQDATRAHGALVPLAPTSAQGPIGRLYDAFTALRNALEPVGYEITKLPPALLIRLQSQEVSNAALALEQSAQAC